MGNKDMVVKRIIFVILFTAITIAVSSQKRERQKVVLNDGSVITGTIVADSNDFLKIKIKRPQVITLSKAHVFSTGTTRRSQYYFGEAKGYSIRLSTSLLAGGNERGNIGSLSIHLSNGYQFKSGLAAGFRTGIEQLDVVVMPVYGDLRYQPFKTRMTPFIWIKSGYGIPLSNNGKGVYYYGNYTESIGGLMFNVGTGVALYTWNRNGINIGIGYRYQKLRFEDKNRWTNEISNELVTSFKRIEVQFGFIFR